MSDYQVVKMLTNEKLVKHSELKTSLFWEIEMKDSFGYILCKINIAFLELF
jgi:hypothetical protein